MHPLDRKELVDRQWLEGRARRFVAGGCVGGWQRNEFFFIVFSAYYRPAYFFADSATGAKERNSVMTSSSPTWLKSS